MDRKKLSLVVVLVVLLAFALVGCKKAGKTSAELGLKPGETATGSEAGSKGALGGSGGAKSQTPTPSVAPANNDGTAGGSTNTGGDDDGAGNTGGTGTKKPSDSNTTPTGGKSLVVKILWWNDTNSKAPGGCEIVFGTSSFKPAVSKDSVTGSIGPVPLGTPSQLVVYPDGRSGKKIVVPFAVDASMQADSERDAIHVEISDTRVRVLGNPIDGFDKTFDRF